MPQLDCIAKLLDIKDGIFTDVEQDSTRITVKLSLKRREQVCPNCHNVTDRVHDYRTQYVKDLPVLGKYLTLEYRKRRYVCPCCGKRFYEPFYLLPKCHRITNRTAIYGIQKLENRISEKQAAADVGVSPSTIHRWINSVNYDTPEMLPSVLSIDEFKGNTDGEKFQCILTDLTSRTIFDILPTREQTYLMEYFRHFKNRNDVKIVVIDMNKPYLNVIKELFPRAICVIDRFHVARYNTWAMENVRKRVQKELLPDDRKYFKRSRKLLLMHASDLNEENADRVSNMLAYSGDLGIAYYLKERFYDFMASKDRNEAVQHFNELQIHLKVADIKEYNGLLSTLLNWSKYILNAFDVPYSNGFTEGTNNSIKVLKRIAFGYRNFENFRRRILHINRTKMSVALLN